MDKIPLYNIVVNLDDDAEYMSAISFVESPAVNYQFITFNKEKPQLKFSVDNELEHKVTSVVCLCDVPIYRYSPDMGEYFVKFDKTAIDNMIYKYSKLGLQNMVNLQHDENQFVDGVYMTEMYQVNRSKGILHNDFPDVPDFSLMATFKIDNEEVWNDIITGKCNGYSLEIFSSLEPTNTFIESEDIEIPMSEEDYLNSLINELLKDFDVDILFNDSKKKIDIDKIIDDNIQVEIKVNNTSKIIKGWIYTEYVVNGSKNLAIWDNRTWHTINENNIDIIKVVDTKILPNWNNALKHPDFTNIHNIVKEAEGVQKKADKPNNFWEDIIMNKKIVLLKYDDGDGRCETYRQCLVCEYGTTKKGNTAIRAYEYSGASHNVLDGTGEIPDWRTFLISRIIDIKVAPGIFEPITQAPPKFNPNPIKDRDDFIVIYKSVFD